MSAPVATAQTSKERILVALRRLAVHQGHTVPAERLQLLASDLAPYAWADIIAALDAHRKASRYFPQFAELRRLLEPHTHTAGLRGQVPTFRPHRLPGQTSVPVVDPDYRGAPYRFHCDHTPTCTTWPDHRTLVLSEPSASLEALNAAARADSDRRTA